MTTENMKYANLTRRMDRLPWSKFHLLVAITLGIGWMLDSFQVNIIGGVLGIISNTFHLTTVQGSFIVSIWLVGIMAGAVIFGYLTDRFGRKKMFLLTLLFYSIFSVCTVFAWNYSSLLLFRFLTALGVGGEYSAVNAAIGEFIPPKTRGKVGGAITNMWSVGAIVGSLVNMLFLAILPPQIAWRFGFALGAIVAIFAIIARKGIPESPRWFIAKNRYEEARKVVDDLEERIKKEKSLTDLPAYEEATEFAHHNVASFSKQIGELITKYPGRLALGCALDFSEATGYYGLFAFVALVVLPQVHVPAAQIPWFYFIGSIGALVGGFVGAFLLDTAGRKPTVLLGYLTAAISVLILAAASNTGNATYVLWAFTAANLFGTWGWVSAYPTFSEIFPTHLRSTGIGFSVGVGRIGAAIGPVLLTSIATKSGAGTALAVLAGFWGIGVVAMIFWSIFGIEAKNKSLEEISGTL